MIQCHSQANLYQSSQDTLLQGITGVHAEPGKEGLLGGPAGSSQWLKAVSDDGWQHLSVHQIQGGATGLQLAAALTHAHTQINACMQRPATGRRELTWQSEARQDNLFPALHGTAWETDRRTAVQQGRRQPLSSRLRIVCPQAPSGGKSSPVEGEEFSPRCRTAARSACRLPNPLVTHCVPARLLREIKAVEFVSTDGGQFSPGRLTDTSCTSPRRRPRAADNLHGQQV